MTFSTQTIHTFNGLVLPYQPGLCFNSKEVLTCEKNNHIYLGYLADDRSAENPLELYDTYGKIYTSLRHAPQEEHRKMQKALGLDSEWRPDFELIPESAAVEALLKGIPFAYLMEICEDCYVRGEDQTDKEFVATYFDSVQMFLDHGFATEDDLQKAWEAGRANGTIGDPHAVMLDVYTHSGMVFSIRGAGVQDCFDTAKGAAVWLPNEVCQTIIKDLAELFKKGSFVKSKGIWGVQLHGELPTQLLSFKDYQEAHNYLDLAEGNPAYFLNQLEAERKAALHLATDALDVHNAYLAGDVHGLVFVAYDKTTREEVQQEATWGYYSKEYAQAELKECFCIFTRD